MSLSHVPVALRRLVRERALERCEYCLIPEAVTFAVHWIDHIIAEKHGGLTNADNLALSCVLCNQHKGSDLTSIDPETGLLTTLFHPRQDRWTDHCTLTDGSIQPKTSIGRVTVRLLQLNHPDRVRERELLLAAKLIGPP
ncbi:MAG: HNH endonuclease [Planctomycetia bacterium]|nr:HNH endonuclease [Planctomycetia bacterium]